jgi:NADP-dependent 3-hydroxy acid dehydrogenase YdfG
MPAAPVAIVTAASKGIGAACARLLAQRGYHLALFARGSELGNLATELDALAVTGDLADSAAIDELVHQTQQRYGGSTLLSITRGTRPKAIS